ncbi:hypothetical protein NE615_27855, partial [Escherichia coli]
ALIKAKCKRIPLSRIFAFIKATEGEKLVDPYFSRNWQLSRENGLLRGAYHYFSPSVSASVQAPEHITEVRTRRHFDVFQHVGESATSLNNPLFQHHQ